jgi:hypothetical protein
MPTVRGVYKIVAYLALWQKLVLWSERESGMTITAHLTYARFTQAGKRSIAPWQKRWTHKGKPGKIRRWSADQPSFPTFAS